jgi:hypothetical protein
MSVENKRERERERERERREKEIQPPGLRWGE